MSNATRRIKAMHYDGSRYAETYELKGKVKKDYSAVTY